MSENNSLNESQSSAARQLAEYRQRAMSQRAINNTQSTSQDQPQVNPEPAQSDQLQVVERSAFEMDSANGSNQSRSQSAAAVAPEQNQSSNQQTEYEKMIEAQMRMYPEGFQDEEAPMLQNDNNDASQLPSSINSSQRMGHVEQPQVQPAQQAANPEMAAPVSQAAVAPEQMMSAEQAFLLEQQMAMAMYEVQNEARRANGGELPSDFDEQAASQRILAQMQSNMMQQQLQLQQPMLVPQQPQMLEQQYAAYPGGPQEEWPASRASRSNSMNSQNESQAEHNEEPRVRDRHKKMNVPCFGLVYKRHLMVHAIAAFLLTGYITLLCLV